MTNLMEYLAHIRGDDRGLVGGLVIGIVIGAILVIWLLFKLIGAIF